VALGVAEIFTLTAAFGVLAGAALVTSGLAAAGLPLPVQLVAFTGISTAGVVLARRAISRLQRRPASRFGVDALIGKPALVTREVTSFDGRIRVDGQEWTARPFDQTQVIPVGATVDVIEITGSTAVVFPGEEPWKSQLH